MATTRLRAFSLVAAHLLALAALAFPATAQREPPPDARTAASPETEQQGVPRYFEPDTSTGLEPKRLARARTHMVAAANPYAVEAGLEILRAGGTALDAAIAVQLVLTLVEPQSSGIGGGAFLLHWDGRARRLSSFDGRETAPAGARPDLLLAADGKPRRFWEAVSSGDSVGAPGVIRMLALAHARHGRLPWPDVFAPAIRLADEGFAVTRRLALLVAQRGASRLSPEARSYFFPGGEPLKAGAQLTNPELAATLRRIALQGPEAFYKGETAEAIIRAVNAAPSNNRSRLSLADLAGYAAVERQPVCTAYRGRRICGMGPPSSGGLATAITLKLVEPFDLGRAPMSAAAVHLIVEAQKLAYADRDRWIADPDRVAVPAGLLDPAYLLSRRRLLDAASVQPKAVPGTPPGALARRVGVDATAESAGTSHVSIVDRHGSAVALTTSIETLFGSGLMAGGFLLNNQLTDFSFRPFDDEGRPVANAPGPGKRPRSSMAPTMIFDGRGRLVAVLGSPGGSRIPLYVIKSVVGLIDWGLDAQAAVDLPNFGSRNGPLEIEQEVAGALLPLKLRALGHDVRPGPMASGAHVIVRRPDGRLEGGADPRREGVARGD